MASASALQVGQRAVKQPGVRQQQQRHPPLAPDPRWLAAWSRLVTTRQQLRMHTNLSRGACTPQKGRHHRAARCLDSSSPRPWDAQAGLEVQGPVT